MKEVYRDLVGNIIKIGSDVAFIHSTRRNKISVGIVTDISSKFFIINWGEYCYKVPNNQKYNQRIITLK